MAPSVRILKLESKKIECDLCGSQHPTKKALNRHYKSKMHERAVAKSEREAAEKPVEVPTAVEPVVTEPEKDPEPKKEHDVPEPVKEKSPESVPVKEEKSVSPELPANPRSSPSTPEPPPAKSLKDTSNAIYDNKMKQQMLLQAYKELIQEGWRPIEHQPRQPRRKKRRRVAQKSVKISEPEPEPIKTPVVSTYVNPVTASKKRNWDILNQYTKF